MYALGQLPTGVSAQAAAAFIQEKIREFRALESKLIGLQHRAAILERELRDRGDVEGAREAKDSRERIADLYIKYGETLDRLNGILEKVPGLGAVPVIPLAIAATVIAVATSMAFILGRSRAEEAALELIAEGQLTPGEWEEIKRQGGGPLGQLSSVARYAALGVGLYFGLPLLARLFK